MAPNQRLSLDDADDWMAFGAGIALIGSDTRAWPAYYPADRPSYLIEKFLMGKKAIRTVGAAAPRICQLGQLGDAAEQSDAPTAISGYQTRFHAPV